MLLERTAHHHHQHGHMLMPDTDSHAAAYSASGGYQRSSHGRTSSSKSGGGGGRGSSVFESMKGRAGILAHWSARRSGHGGSEKAGKDASVAAQVNMEGGRDRTSSGRNGAGAGEGGQQLRSSAPPGGFDLDGWLNGAGAGEGGAFQQQPQPQRASSFAATTTATSTARDVGSSSRRAAQAHALARNASIADENSEEHAYDGD